MIRRLLLLPVRLIWWLLRFVRRTWSIISVFVVLALLATNVLTLVSSWAYRLASSAIELVAEGASLRVKKELEIDELKTDLDSAQRRSVDLEGELADVRQQREELADQVRAGKLRLDEAEIERNRLQTRVSSIEAEMETEKLRAARLSSQLDIAQSDAARAMSLADDERAQREVLQRDLEDIRADRDRRAEFIDARTRSIERRSRAQVAREMASMPLESIPWFGVATIVAVTGLELKDLCDNSKDMQEIRTAFGLADTGREGGNEVCGQDIWTVKEIRAWLLDGEDGRIGERCRQLVEDLGVPLAEGCPGEEPLPPLPVSMEVSLEPGQERPDKPATGEPEDQEPVDPVPLPDIP